MGQVIIPITSCIPPPISASNPNIIYYDITTNDYDYELDIEIPNRKELLKLLENLKSKFQVRDVEILSFKEYYKLELIPS